MRLSILTAGLTAVLLCACAAKPDSSFPLPSPSPLAQETFPLPSSGKQAKYTYELKEEDSYDSRYEKRGFIHLGEEGGKARYRIFSGEKSTGGYGLELAGIQETDGVVTVVIRETSPGPDSAVTTALTYPCITLSLSPVPSSVVFESEDGRAFACMDDEIRPLKRALKTGGILYLDTGYACAPAGRCGNMDGYPEVILSTEQMPENDGEANFETTGWQISGTDTLDVLIGNEFRIFAAEGSPYAEGEAIPDNVLQFMAVVEEVREDGTVIVTTDTPAAWGIPENTRFVLPLSAYDPGIYVDTPVPGNPVIVVCGGTIAEGDPYTVKDVYKFSPIGSQAIQTIEPR